MKFPTLDHNLQAVQAALRTDKRVFWRNTFVNTNWQVLEARKRSFNLQVRVAHPIFGKDRNDRTNWYVVDQADVLTLQ